MYLQIKLCLSWHLRWYISYTWTRIYYFNKTYFLTNFPSASSQAILLYLCLLRITATAESQETKGLQSQKPFDLISLETGVQRGKMTWPSSQFTDHNRKLHNTDRNVSSPYLYDLSPDLLSYLANKNEELGSKRTYKDMKTKSSLPIWFHSKKAL